MLPAAKPAATTTQKIYCDICKKAFSTKNQFLQHERSKRHLKGLKEAQEAFQKSEEGVEDVKEDVSIKEDAKENGSMKEVGGMTEAEVVTEGGVATETETATDTLPFQPEAYTFDPNRCIFCGTISDSLDANIAHMTQKHGFLIPDRQCLKDVEGLLDYLGQKISVGCICIGCNHGFKSPHAVRAHMFDKGHTRMAYDTEEDFEEFESFYDYEEENAKEEEIPTLRATGELELSDGRILGNREYTRYYKQSYATESERREALKTKLLLGNGPASQQATAIMLYQEQKQTVVEKRADVERLHRYAIRERLRAGMNMNKIHLAHFCH
ncbi:hypothetical protein WA556_004707, partial [Blastocystis sp. ATCC 50177/Nand II]